MPSRASRNLPAKGKRYAFVIDGECEQWYIAMLKRNEGIHITTDPQLIHQRSIEAQYLKVCELAEDYTKVFWIIDLDVVIDHTRQSKGGETEMQVLKRCYRETAAKENVVTIINAPGLEYWYLLHFKQTNRSFDSCDDVIREIKKQPALKDYQKTEKYYKHQNDIYLRLKPYLQTGIANARQLPAFDPDNCEVGLSEMDELFSQIEELK